MRTYYFKGLLILALLCPLSLFSQVVYYVTGTNELHYLELSSCTDTIIVQIVPPLQTLILSDVAIAPDGVFYVSYSETDITYILAVDLSTGQLNGVATFPQGCNGMVFDAQGTLWCGYQNLYSCNVSTGAVVNHGFFGLNNLVGGDFTFRNGKLYMIDVLSRIVLVNIDNPFASDVVWDISNELSNAFGLFSVYYSCDSIVTYSSGTVVTFPPGGGIDFNTKIGAVDFTNGAVTFSNCIFPPGASINGATSPLEYLGSLCLQNIDLDANNSSGQSGGDYATSTVGCSNLAVSLVDIDVSVDFPEGIDSLQVFLNPAATPPNSAAESIVFNGSPGISATGNNTGHLVLTGTSGNTADSLYRQALFELLYRNSATPASSGMRTVFFVPWNNGFALDTVYAFINVVATVSTDSVTVQVCPGATYTYAGVSIPAGESRQFMLQNALGCDSILTVTVAAIAAVVLDAQTVPSCANIPTGLIHIQNPTGGLPPYMYSIDGGAFQGSLNFTNLPAGAYLLTTLDSLHCEATAEVIIEALASLQVTLDNASLPCNSTFIELAPLVGGYTNGLRYQWSTGATTPVLQVGEPGMVWVEVSNVCETVRREALILQDSTLADAPLQLPNVFAPAAIAPENRVFKPILADRVVVTRFLMRVFDRWGNVVFESLEPTNGWDGSAGTKAATPDVYAWYIEADLQVCGKLGTFRKSGDITLLR